MLVRNVSCAKEPLTQDMDVAYPHKVVMYCTEMLVDVLEGRP